MQIYFIEGKEEEKLSFIKDLAKDLSRDKKCLLISFKRNKSLNLEDIYDMEGMITYDICDYFLNLVKLDEIINKACENIDFIIAPLLEDKYKIKKEDIDKLLNDLSSYDYIIIENISKDILDNKKSIEIITKDDLNKDIDSDYFFIESEDDFDLRPMREDVLGKSSKFLGLKKSDDSYKEIIDNLKNDKKAEIEKLSFIEKIKMKFIK